MRLKMSYLLFLSFLSWFTLFVNLTLGAQEAYQDKQDQLIQSLGSLVYYVNNLKENLNQQLSKDRDKKESEEHPTLTDEEMAVLWNKAGLAFDYFDYSLFHQQQRVKFQESYQRYYRAKELLFLDQIEEAELELNQALSCLIQTWHSTSEEFISLIPSSSHLILTSFRGQEKTSLDDIKSISSKIKKKIAPYAISLHHPMKSQLDAIFTKKRVTLNDQTLAEAGFITIASRPRTHIRVLRHPFLVGYLIKANLDSDTYKKRGKSSWNWLVKRCEGAEKVRRIIQTKHIKYFTVADKWIYPLPDHPSPPKSSSYTRHLAVLLVTDMQLASNKQNLDAWWDRITEKHLDELYTIISYAKGSSYRPDNISYTIYDQFAFIDTEYPGQGPDYTSIKPYLRPKMRVYWEKLIKNGGS